MCLQIESQWKSIALGPIIALGLKTMLGLMSNAGAQRALQYVRVFMAGDTSFRCYCLLPVDRTPIEMVMSIS